MANLESIKRHYSTMSDARLEQIAKFEIASLQPEVQPIVMAEIRKRGLDENLFAGIEAQTEELTEDELSGLMDKVKRLPCPICGEPDKGLAGGIIRKVRSYLIFTLYERRSIIACQTCVDTERKNQLIKNCLFGWWGVPWGLFIRTPQAIINHFIDNSNKKKMSEAVLRAFVYRNIGELKINWENEERLVDFIEHQNNVLL